MLKGVAALPGVGGKIAMAVTAFLKIPIGNLAYTAYEKHRLVEKARKETLADSSRQVLQLAQHEMKVERKIEVDGEVSGVRHKLVELDLVVTIKVDVMSLTIVNGEVVDARQGRRKRPLELKAGESVIAERDFRPVDLGSLIFGDGASGSGFDSASCAAACVTAPRVGDMTPRVGEGCAGADASLSGPEAGERGAVQRADVLGKRRLGIGESGRRSFARRHPSVQVDHQVHRHRRVGHRQGAGDD